MCAERALSALLVVGLASSAASASAQPALDEEARAARLITLAVATHTDEDVTQIVAYLRPLLEMRGLLLAVRRVDSLDSASSVRSSSQPGVRARVWLDLKTPNQAQVLFAVGEQPSTAGRVVPTAARIDQVAAAEIAEIILTALVAPEGALAAARLSGERPPQLAAAPAPGPQPGGTWQRSLGILAAAQSWAEGASAIPEVGLSALFEWRPAAATWRRAVWSTLRYRPPFEPAQGPLPVRVRGGEAEVLGVLAHGIGGRGSVGLAAGVGLDGRFVDPMPPAGTALADPQSVRELALFLRTAVRFDVRLHGPLNLFAALTLDLFPLQDRLLVKQSGAARPVFTPRPLRPGALAGASLVF
jgi:hypothetical protein